MDLPPANERERKRAPGAGASICSAVILHRESSTCTKVSASGTGTNSIAATINAREKSGLDRDLAARVSTHVVPGIWSSGMSST